MNRNVNTRRSRGFTLIEILIGMAIITTAFLGLATVFGSLSKGILVNKTKTIATNLAQEKIESLKNYSYFRLLITTASTTDSNFPGVLYDNGYYPEEMLSVGGLLFRRRTYVELLKQDGTDLVSQPWTANDTGIKRITVYVMWEEDGDWKKVELSNMRNNPARAQLEYTFSGRVSSGATGSGIYNAMVETVQNPSYFSRTDASGNYSFKVSPGTYTLRASATGYFTALSTNYIVAADVTGSASHNFGLSLMAQGNATGYAFISDHLIISQVVVATNPLGGGLPPNQEYVELYNPTTYNILIASRSVAGGPFDIFFVTVTWIDDNNSEPVQAQSNKSAYLMGVPDSVDPTLNSKFVNFRSTSIHWSANTSTISIPSQHFFLIANVSTVTLFGLTRIADAYYTGNIMDSTNDGGVRVTGRDGKPYNTRTDWHDGVSWNGSGSDLALEGGTPYGSIPTAGNTIYREYPAELNWITIRNLPNPRANCYDTNDSREYSAGGDWDETPIGNIISGSTMALLNSDSLMASGPCTPATGASVSMNDGLSSVEYVTDSGSFTVTNIATGTWTMVISSGSFTRDVASVTITPSLSTAVPNNSTNPKAQIQTLTPPWGFIALSSSTDYGYVSGVVRDGLGNPISSAEVYTSGASSVFTNSQGKYRLSVIPSDSVIAIIASKSGYSTEIVDDVWISLGVNVSTVNFTLVSAGSIRGFVSSNGVASGALPGISVVAYDSSTSTILGNAITQSDGNFVIPSIATGTYIVAPQLESGESASPENARIFVSNNSTGTWSSTFTVANAYGEISGSVLSSNSGMPITTGVLIVASTGPILTDTPPVNNSSLRSGAQIYYAVSSDASGRYTLPLRGGSSYYLYGWYPTSLDVNGSTTPKRQVTSPSATHSVNPGATVTRNITW